MNLLGDWVNNWWIDAESAAAGEAADAKNREINRRLVNDGKMLPSDYELSEHQFDVGSFDKLMNDPATSPIGGFNQSIDESLENVRDTIGGVATGAGTMAFRAIPVWIWALAALWLAWNFGLLRGFSRR